MYQINFNQPIHVHFIGIGGISMSGLAEIILQEGFTVSGSDSKASAITAMLEKLGATIAIGQKADSCYSQRQSGVCCSRCQRETNADTCTDARTDHGEL